MEMNEKYLSYIDEVLQRNNKIVISLSDCDVNILKKLTQAYAFLMLKYPASFCILKKDKETAEEALKSAIDMLVSRGFLGILDGQEMDESFSSIASTGEKRLLVVVRNLKDRSKIIKAGKSAGIYIDFCKLNDDGTIEKWPSEQAKSQDSSNNRTNELNQPRNNGKNNRKLDIPFKVKDAPEQFSLTRIITSIQLDVGNTVYDSSGNKYKLTEKVLTNNGASTYKTDVKGVCVKLYDKEHLNTFFECKINRMIKNPIKITGVCWPLDLATDEQKIFRGYFMEEVVGEPLHLSVMKRAGIENYFPNWDKKNLCTLALTILDKIDRLHKNGVLMGCINPAAIRVVDDTTVFFTDTDNYQVEGYPSFVYNISFTPPELLGKKIYLTNLDSENFAIAELLFMIIMTGKTPYAVGINGDPESEIKKMNFPYSNRKIHGNAALPSMWRFMWSHLTPFKEPFYETFQRSGKYNRQGQRKDTGFWIGILKGFIKDLNDPIDKESLKIYPRTFKRGRNDVFYKCEFCGVEHPRFYFSDSFFEDYRICNDCIDKQSNVFFKCVDCGKIYYYTNRTALFHKQKKEQDASWKNQKHCRDCKRKTILCSKCGKEYPFYMLKNDLCPDCNAVYRKQVYKQIQCKVCGRMFDFTYGDRDFYEKKGYNQPAKCPDCRNGGHKNQRDTNWNNYSYATERSSASEKPSKKGLLSLLFGKRS